MKKHAPEISFLLKILDEAYERKAWHGPNLRGAIRGLTATKAAWKPSRNRHSIWELVTHAAYWKYAVHRKLTGVRRGSFPIKGSNWFTVEGRLTERQWERDRDLLDHMHRALQEAVSDLKPSDLRKKVEGSPWTIAQMVYGVALHDIYHTGQIQLIKRLMKK